MNEKQKIVGESGPDVGEIKTVCRDCCFAEYEEDTQIGCKLGKIDKFRETGSEIVEAYDEIGKEFYIINDRFCVFWREPDWKDSQYANIPKDKRNDSSLATRVRHEVRAKFLTILYIDKDSTLKGLKKTVNSIKSGALRPVKIIFCDNKSNIETKEILKIAKSSSCLWGIEKIAEESASKLRCVDICMRKSKSMQTSYYSVFSSGNVVPKDFYSDIDSVINDDLETFLALYPKEKEDEGDVSDGFVGQVHIHKQIGGSAKKPFIEKLFNVTESQECPHLIKPLAEVTSLK